MKLFGDWSDCSSPVIQSGHFAFTVVVSSVGTSWVEVIHLSLFVSKHVSLKTDLGLHVGLKASQSRRLNERNLFYEQNYCGKCSYSHLQSGLNCETVRDCF